MKDIGSRLKDQGWDKMTADEQKANKEIYENVHVRAIISMSGEKLPDGENLWSF